MSAHHVLITGGTGLIGKPLTQALLAQGYTVSHLSRGQGKNPAVKTYQWNVDKQTIDPNCITGVDTIVHLAGAGIASGLWTKKRKQQIIDSRVDSIHLVYKLLKDTPGHNVKQIISAGGISIYGDTGDKWQTESNPPENSFIGECCVAWEAAVNEGKSLGLDVSILRTGVVLTTKGGALVPLALPVKFGVGAALGNGRQYVPWLHMHDAVQVYMDCINNKLPSGVYNMVAPNPVTNKQLTQAVAKQLRRPLWLPNVPAFLLKLVFGEMSSVVLGSTRASAKKLIDAGYQFKFYDLADALKDIYDRKKSR